MEDTQAPTASEDVEVIADANDPPAQATDIIDAEVKGLNDPEDATTEHGDTDRSSPPEDDYDDTASEDDPDDQDELDFEEGLADDSGHDTAI